MTQSQILKYLASSQDNSLQIFGVGEGEIGYDKIRQEQPRKHRALNELHQEHGLHVHLVTNRFIDVNRARESAMKAGWGRIHVARMPSEHAGYVAKYLSKERPECLYHWRLWAGFGRGWEWTKVKDVIRETLFSRIYRACKEWKSWTGRGQFFDRMDLVPQMMILTVEHAWPIGCGPGGVPYGRWADDFWLL